MPQHNRTVFFVSDGTGITAEMLGHSLLTQFEGIEFTQVVMPFVDTAGKAQECLARIEEAKARSPARPIVFCTLVDESLRSMLRRADALVLDFDNSVTAAMLRWRNLPEMLAHSGVLYRMVHGSDYPFPSNGLVHWNRLPPQLTARLVQENNLLERDVQLKRALGIPQPVSERGAKLLGLV